jgi:hypothetical protein
MKHTPEPWRASDTTQDVSAQVEGHDCRIVHAYHLQRFKHSAKANAQRIVDCVNACQGLNPAAVPELLSAAKDALESLKCLPDADKAWRITCIGQLEKAIALATNPTL